MKFSVIGGDLRLSNLAQKLADDKNEVYTFGMENAKNIIEDKRIKKCKNIYEAIQESNTIIGSIPLLKDEKEMHATFSNKRIKLDELVDKNYKNKTFIAGSISNKAKEKLEKSYGKVIDIMKEEELVVLNTIATAEGAVDVAIQNTDTIIHGSNVLILGFGRVAKEVANKFYGLSAKVTCAARKKTDLAWINAMGYEAVNIYGLQEDLKQYDIIINTVPQMIIDKEEMQYMKKNVLLIDLASSPGGINTNDAKKFNLKFVWALALPRKSSPCEFSRVYKTDYLQYYTLLKKFENLAIV